MQYKDSYKNLTIGSDPEVFVKKKGKTELASIIGTFNAGKDDPKGIGKGCFIQEDNILAEFNIPPCKTEEEFVESINYAKSTIELMIAPLGMELHYSSSEIATDDILKDEKAHVFGCEPAFNSIVQSMIEIDPEEIKGIKMRSSGFHIHFGWDNPTDEERDRLVLCFELCVTLPLLYKDEDDHNRRKFYGKIGDMRDKTYGVEARSLGGYFLKDDESIRDIYQRSLKAVELARTMPYSNEELLSDFRTLVDPNEDIDIENIDKLLIKYKKIEYANI